MQKLVDRRGLNVDRPDVFEPSAERTRFPKCRYSDTGESDRRHDLARRSVAAFK
jgi:hypothetical protein